MVENRKQEPKVQVFTARTNEHSFVQRWSRTNENREIANVFVSEWTNENIRYFPVFERKYSKIVHERIITWTIYMFVRERTLRSLMFVRSCFVHVSWKRFFKAMENVFFCFCFSKSHDKRVFLFFFPQMFMNERTIKIVQLERTIAGESRVFVYELGTGNGLFVPWTIFYFISFVHVSFIVRSSWLCKFL